MPRLLGGLAAAGVLLLAAAPAQGAPSVAVYPSPGTSYNLPATQITFRGVPADQLGQIQVVGSQSGQHSGQVEADADGNGGSFVPDQPFKKGEKVTVTTSLNVIGATNGTFSFKIANAGLINPGPLLLVHGSANALQHFHSRPDLLPPALTVSQDSAPSSEGDIFLAPQYGPAQTGPMILDPRGRLVWFDPFPVSKNLLITDFRVQTYKGQPALTWWQGYGNRGSGRGVGIIFNHSYQQVAVVHAGNGLDMDLHEFLLTPNQTAWVIAVSPVYLPGISKMVSDAVIQQIDIRTGLVLFEWHALDHIPLSYSYMGANTKSFVFDPYHMNSVAPYGSGSLLVSMRNTSAVYKVNVATGKIQWELGGKHSSFHLLNGAGTVYQHDAVPQSDGTITIFDDEGGPPNPHPARGIRVALNTGNMTARVVSEYDHSPKFDTNFEGSVQPLSDGNVFIGWGQQPYFSEDDSHGHQIFDARFVVPSSSYRAYRFRWSGQPPASSTPPAAAVGPGPAGTTNVYASWNGATDVAAWRVLAGPSPTTLSPAVTHNPNGFETVTSLASQLPYFAAQALDSNGNVLATSAVVQSPPHLALFGRSAFVSGAGTGSVPVACVAPKACSVALTVSAGSTTIAATGRQVVGAGKGGLVYFTLNGGGRSLLAHARGGRLPVSVSAHATGGLSAVTSLQLVPFGTSGGGPRRSASQSSTVQLVGLTDFVSPGGTGGILLGCYKTSSCRISGKLTAGATTIAATQAEFIGPGELGYLVFSLNGAGRSLLAHASGNQLGTHVALSTADGSPSGDIALVAFK